MQLQGGVAFVTGASRGIGAVIAAALAARGAFVVLNYRQNAELAEACVERIRAAGGNAEARQADVCDLEAMRALVGDVTARVGGIDVLVNNAGIVRDRTFKKMQPGDWRDVIETNLIGVMNSTHAVLPSMLERGRGRIVSISSFVGQAGAFGQTNYAAAKAGVIGFTKSLALEVAPSGVTVNCICPGFIDTEMWQSIRPDVREKLLAKIPLGRTGAPEEVAAMVEFLVERGDYVTGQSLNVNGGIYLG